MKISPHDVYDRFQHFKKKDFDIGTCCQNMIDQRPFGEHPFYIFAHSRTDDDGINKRMIWQPRLTKPLAQTNSMLFKAYPGTDNIKVIWMIPARELWGQYNKGLITENQTIAECIHDFEFNRQKLNKPEDDDLSEQEIHQIYKDISNDAKKRKN